MPRMVGATSTVWVITELFTGVSTRDPNDQWDADGRVVKSAMMKIEFLLAQILTVVTGEDDDGVVPQLLGL